MNNTHDLWLQSWPARLTPLVDFVCIAGAGAGASRFKPWQTLMPGFCALHVVQLPGRENRIDEPPNDDMAVVVEQIAASCMEKTKKHRPLILFGHSMGAVLAYELAHRLQLNGNSPAALVLSATTPPTGQSDRPAPDDDDLKRRLLAFDAGNQSVVDNPDLFSSLAPALRADFQLLRRHSIAPERKLTDVSTMLLVGKSDPVVPAASVALWKKHLGDGVSEHVFDGGHQFPFQESLRPVTRLMSDLVKQRISR